MTDILRCVRCGRRGRAFAFWQFAHLPEPYRGVWCPSCRARDCVIDETGRPAQTAAPVQPSILDEAQRVAQLAVGRPPGRRAHGGVL